MVLETSILAAGAKEWVLLAAHRHVTPPLLQGHGVPPPPDWLLQALAARLRAHLGLSLFNFDVIVPASGSGGGAPGGLGGEEGMPAAAAAGGGDEFLLHLIDINYFPGFEKLEGYEAIMVDFLLSLWPPA